MTGERNALGRAGEDAAASYLRARGWDVIARNVRRREGEVDIVARRGDTVAFVEVKTRRTRRFGSPAEAVTRRKQTTIRGLALAMLDEGLRARHLRFDVIEVFAAGDTLSLRHIEAAF